MFSLALCAANIVAVLVQGQAFLFRGFRGRSLNRVNVSSRYSVISKWPYLTEYLNVGSGGQTREVAEEISL